MRIILTLVCLLFAFDAARAQTSQPPLTQLNGLKAGQKIQIVESNSKKDIGTFEAASETAISIRDAGGERSIPIAEVRGVKLVGTNRRLRHTLIGLGVGAGGGAAIGAAVGPSDRFVGKGVSAAILGTAGGICGTVVGVLLPTHETVYTSASH